LHALHVPAQALLQQTPSAQKVLRHSAFPPHACPRPFLQAPSPSHWLGAAQVPRSLIPFGTFEQVPTVPARLHALQVPTQAVLQQKPSAQSEVAHSLPAAQTCPLLFL